MLRLGRGDARPRALSLRIIGIDGSHRSFHSRTMAPIGGRPSASFSPSCPKAPGRKACTWRSGLCGRVRHPIRSSRANWRGKCTPADTGVSFTGTMAVRTRARSRGALLPRGPRAGLLADGVQAAGHRTAPDPVHRARAHGPAGRRGGRGWPRPRCLSRRSSGSGDWTAWMRLGGQLSTVVLQARVTAALQALPRGREPTPLGRALPPFGPGVDARHRGHDRCRTILRVGRPCRRIWPSGRDLSRGLPGVPGGLGSPGRARSAARLRERGGPRQARWPRRPSS